MNSMTGFGKAEVKSRFGTLTVEISSVNNRFLEMSPRLPRSLAGLEPKLRELIGSKLSRGKISFYVGFDENDGKARAYIINRSAVTAYYRQLQKLRKELNIDEPVTLRDIILLPEATAPEEETIDEQAVWNVLKRVTLKAMAGLMAMRQKEGRAMARDMTGRLTILQTQAGKIKRRAKVSVGDYRKKLTRRLQELLESPVPDYLKIEEQIALMAEKTDITEECTRFVSHIQQFRSTLRESGPMGKKLNFILQELNREANTIASKSTDAKISVMTIGVKEEIEKIRELVQNVE